MRLANEDDLPRLVEMGTAFHALSPIKDAAPFSADAFEATLRNVFASDAAAVFVNETGMIGVVCAPVYFSEVRFAQELFWYGGGFELLKAAEQWAAEQGAAAFLMLRVEGLTERLDKIYRRRGYAPVEHTYAKVL